jgi:hypothetical protein
MGVEGKTSLNKICVQTWLLDSVSVFGEETYSDGSNRKRFSVTESRMNNVQNCDSYIDFVRFSNGKQALWFTRTYRKKAYQTTIKNNMKHAYSELRVKEEAVRSWFSMLSES